MEDKDVVKSILANYKIRKGLILEELLSEDFNFICSYYKVSDDELVIAFYPTATHRDKPRDGTLITNKRVITSYEGELTAAIDSLTWADISICITDVTANLKFPNGVKLNVSDPKIFRQLLNKLVEVYGNVSELDLGLAPQYGDFSEEELIPRSEFEKDWPSKVKWLKVVGLLMIPFFFLAILNKYEGKAAVLDIPSVMIPSAPAGAKVIDYWYDDIKDMEAWNSVFMQYEVAGDRYIVRKYLDGKTEVYYPSGRGYYIRRGRPNAHYTITSRGMEMSDKAGFIRTAKKVKFAD